MPADENYAVIWDMDGTLVDTAEQHYQAWARLTRELNIPFTREGFAATFGRRNPEVIRTLFGKHYTEKEIADIGERKERLYRAAASQGVELLPGVGSLLRGLRSAGIKQGVGSSAPRDNLTLIVKLTETAHFFDCIVAMEDTQRGKPDPQVFLLAAEKLGISPARCLVMEDAVAGVQAAKAGGMKCIAVSFAGHHSPEALAQAGADRVVKTLDEVAVENLEDLFRR